MLNSSSSSSSEEYTVEAVRKFVDDLEDLDKILLDPKNVVDAPSNDIELSELIDAVERYIALLNERNPEKLKEALNELEARGLTLSLLNKICRDILREFRGAGDFSNKLLSASYLENNIALAALLEERGLKLNWRDFPVILGEAILKNKVDVIKRLFSKREFNLKDAYGMLSYANPELAKLISEENEILQNASSRRNLFQGMLQYEAVKVVTEGTANFMKQPYEEIIHELEGFRGIDQKMIAIEIDKIISILKQQHEVMQQRKEIFIISSVTLALTLKNLEALVNNNKELSPSQCDEIKFLIKSIFKDVPFFGEFNEERTHSNEENDDKYSETAMDEVKPEEKELYYKIKEQYSGEFYSLCKKEDSSKKRSYSEQIDLTNLTCYPILSQLEQYLINQFEREGLSTVYPKGASDEELNDLLPQYYNNIFHTAWRYLFARPNPWIAPDAEMAENNASDISSKEFEKIAYFWLAARDEGTPCIDDFTLKARMEHFAQTLALFGREYSEEPEGDKPTCIGGVERRCYQLLIAHPVIDVAAEKLTPDSFIEFFRKKFLTPLFAELNTFTPKELSSVNQALKERILNAGDIDRVDRQILKLLNLKMKGYDIDDFNEELSRKFGKKQVKQKVTYQYHTCKSYKELAKKILKNHLEIFAGEILGKINSLLVPKDNTSENSNENSMDFNETDFPSSPIITTSYKNLKKRDNKEIIQDEQDDEIKEPETKKIKNGDKTTKVLSESYNSSDFDSLELSDEESEKTEKSSYDKKRKF